MKQLHYAETRRARKSSLSRTFLLEHLEQRQLLASWYAAPTGVASNPGTLEAPWDLSTALNNVNVIDPGDTLYLRGGTYRFADRSHGNKGYSFHLDGAAGAPITVRPYQQEHAIIDGGLHSDPLASSQYLTIMGLEVLVSENLTRTRTSPVAGSVYPADLNRPFGGVDVTSGYAIKLVNNVIHANAQGVGFWKNVGGDSTLYGNVIYDNGWIGPDRPHGPAIYTQNAAAGWKHITDNLAFDNYYRTLEAYGSTSAPIDRYEILRNVFWDDEISSKHDALIGGERPSTSLRVEDNVAYKVDIRMGYVDGGNDAVVRDNTVRGEIEWTDFTNLTATNNLEWAIGAAQPTLDGIAVPTPVSPLVFLNTNAYDAQRANLAILNHLGTTQVAVNPGTFLRVGDSYRVMKPTDMWGTPAASGTYTGGSISVPTPSGFAAYVVLASSTNTRPTITNITNMTLTLGTPVPLRTFIIGDAQSPANTLTLSATSDNPALTPVSGLIFGGSGANRTLQINPTPGITGTSFITVQVRDPGGLVGKDIIRITINPASSATPLAAKSWDADSLSANQRPSQADEVESLASGRAADAVFEELSRASGRPRSAIWSMGRWKGNAA